MDVRLLHNCKIRMGTTFRRQIFAFFHIAIILSEAFASPVWMPQFLSGGQGRSIRHLPCVSRRTGDQGICMFAYTCLKSNGTHLGTCIDRFYFGSCCKLNESNDLLVENNFPLINNNQVTSSHYPSDGNTNNVESISVQNGLDKFEENQYSASTKLSYPTKTTQKLETSTNQTNAASTDKTIVDLAQHLATETYFLMPTTEKIYIPVHVSNRNGTEGVDSSAASFTSSALGSSIGGDIKKSTISFQNTYSTTTSQPYLLSTFQVVHNEGDSSASIFTKKATATSATTVKSASNFPIANSTTASPVGAELVSTWTSNKQEIATFSPVFEATTKPYFTTTIKKPVKPFKPYTTTRKPTTKKPTVKPAVKPTSTTRPLSVSVKTTTPKSTTPSKKPTQPTKKPSTSKPSSTKLPTVTRPSVKPTGSVVVAAKPSTLKPVTVFSKTTTKPTFPWAPTTGKYPAFSTFVDTTSEVVFTKPGPAMMPTHTSDYGITTFRPDLGASSSTPSVANAGLTTFGYVSEGVNATTVKSSETTTSRLTPAKPSDHKPTPGYEMSGSYGGGGSAGSIIEMEEENNFLPMQQVGTTARPASSSPGTAEKPADGSVPFFPDSGKPQVSTQWIEMVQTSSKPEASYPPSFAGASNTTAGSLEATLFEGLNQTDYMQVCGRRIYPQARVVGGEKSTFGKWPWQISLRQWRTSTYLHKCGAALLNENWAITAAHCVENVPPSDLLLRLGEHDLSTEDEPFGFQERRVQIVASHPQFDPRTFEYDLALLRFYEPVKFQPNIIPVCVPDDDTNFVGQTAYVTGWGRLYEDGPLPSVLQEVSVPVINNTLCENMYRSAGYIEHIPEIFICAGWKKGGFDSCEGDSGGPMVIQRPDKRWLLAGVISWGIGCAEPNQPGVYTRISEFREWIHQILQF